MDQWMDGGGGSTVNDNRCKPLGSSPAGLTSRWEVYTSQMLVYIQQATYTDKDH